MRFSLLLWGWLGFLLASALTAPACKKERGDSAKARSSAVVASTTASRPPPAAATASARLSATPPADSAPPEPAVDLPPRPKPPEHRDAAERASASKILEGYGFPAHHSLAPLCGFRDFEPGGTTWVTDLFTSPASLVQLRSVYQKRLGRRGLEDDTWRIPATGTVKRKLALKSLEALKRYPRCEAKPPSEARTLIVARRAQ